MHSLTGLHTQKDVFLDTSTDPTPKKLISLKMARDENKNQHFHEFWIMDANMKATYSSVLNCM